MDFPVLHCSVSEANHQKVINGFIFRFFLDKLPWKDFPLGNVPGKDLSTVSLDINWLPAETTTK
jgi:hypothetical protein